MIAYEAISEKIKYFQKGTACIRLIDTADRKLLGEKRFCTLNRVIPPFDFHLGQELYENCVASDETVFHVRHEQGKRYLAVLVPFAEDGKGIVAEFLYDMSGRLYMDNLPLTDCRLNLCDKMHMLVITDELTGLYNRRYINEALPADISACAKRNCPLSVIFADLDYFKAANDRYGHTAGDHVLREIAAELKRHIRADRDWAARYGGDEFLLCLNGADGEEAKNTAERIRAAIVDRIFVYNGHEIKLTCSFGIYTIEDFTKPLTVDAVLDAIDEKLYQAKDRGKNQVI